MWERRLPRRKSCVWSTKDKLELDDPATEHFPPEIAFFDANGATIRDLLGMRSGIADPPGYVSLVDSGSTPADLVEGIGEPLFPAGSQISYANINYVLLGLIIEHVTGGSLWEALASGVLDGPGLVDWCIRRKSALAADGWRIEADSASLARWGYELYGGFVLSDASLGQMTEFRDEWYGLGAHRLLEENFRNSLAVLAFRPSATADWNQPTPSCLSPSPKRRWLSPFKLASILFQPRRTWREP